MADVPVSTDPPMTNDPPVSGGLLAYVLIGIGAVTAVVSHGFPLIAPLMGFLGIAGVIVAYVKRADAQGTWVASHLRWLIRTFWFSLLWGTIGVAFAITIVGLVVAFPIWIATTVWVLYRVIRGYLLFHDKSPIPGM
jgi:uncharacterized membrane protein